MNVAIITDFDGTLMHQDVGDILMEQLGVLEEKQSIEAALRYKRKEHGSMEWARVNYSFLANKKNEVDDILKHIQPRKGARAFLQFCSEHQIPVTVLSDGMEYYIRQLLQLHDLQVSSVIANPITYTENGGYQLQFQNSNPICKWCGCCKADVVRNWKQTGKQIIYIGDGTSDYYGSSFADWVFARGTLAEHLTQAGSPYYEFETFDEILQVLQSALPRFEDGTAERRMTHGNPFCKFE